MDEEFFRDEQLTEKESSILEDITLFIQQHEIDNFSDFITYCLTDAAPDEWFVLASQKSTFYIAALIDSISQKQSIEYEQF